MSSEDERMFVEFLMQNPDVCIITDVRHPTPDFPCVRDLRGVTNTHCHIWNKAIHGTLKSDYYPKPNDYYLRGDESHLQFLRSSEIDGVINDGRIALTASFPGGAVIHRGQQKTMTRWFNGIVRWLKANFTNTFVYALDVKPHIGYKMNHYWVGPDAIARSLRGVRLGLRSAKWSLRYYDKVNEAKFLARFRMLHRCVAIGVVESVGKEVDPMLRRKSFVVRFVESIGAQLTAKVFEGDFMVLYPEPKIGDEVACSFGESLEENVDWESKEIKKLTAKTKAKVLQGLVKNWLKGKSDHYRV